MPLEGGGMTPNREVERPDTDASRATRAHNSEARSRRASTCRSRTAPTPMVSRLFADDVCPNGAFARNGAVMHDSPFLLSSTTAGR